MALRTIAAITRRLGIARPGLVRRWVDGPGRRFGPVEDVVRLDGGPRIRVGTASYVEAHVYFYGSYERDVSRVLRSLAEPAGCAIDVGAHVGVHTLVLADSLGPAGRVIACEPNPEARARLESNVTLNRFGNVEIWPVAILDRRGSVDLHYHDDVPFDATATLADDVEDEVALTTLTVRGETLDALVASARAQAVDIVKIDAEGFEGAVLAGARELLARDRPALVFECWGDFWDRAGYRIEDVVDDLRSLGYSHFASIAPGGTIPLDGAPLVYKNVLATATRHDRR